MNGETDELRVEPSRAEKIAQLNDALRKSGRGGLITVTIGVRNLATFCPFELRDALAKYDTFDDDNDPHRERDFGTLSIFNSGMFWKIDYYDIALEFGSADPANPAVTTRVLTVMLKQEY